MSLVHQALVALTHYVLDGATWAGDRVMEQPIYPIHELLRDPDQAPAPVIAVYVESSKADVTGRRTQGDSAEAVLKVFIHIAPGATKLPDGTAFELNGQTAGLTLNVLGRQVDAAFHTSAAAWLAVWRRFVVSVMERETRYVLVEIEGGVKVPTMEIAYRCKVIPDPDFGVPIAQYGAWQALDTALRADGEEKTMLADLFKTMIESPAGQPAHRVLQMEMGYTDAALQATGMAPVVGATTEEGDPVELDQVTGDIDTVIVPEDE